MGKTSREGTDQKVELSYVLPTYNRAEYLGECLLTLFEQSYNKAKYEVIVVDDGSDDSTQELLTYFKSREPNFRCYKSKHKGVEHARNLGNSKARAPLIGVCDSDDLYHGDRTKLTLKYFKRHPSVDVMNGSYMEIDHRGLPVKFYGAKKLNKKNFIAGGHAEYFCHDNCTYRKDKVLITPYRQGGQQTDDWKLVHDWIKAGYKFGFIDEELCKVRTLKYGIMGNIRAMKGIKLPHA